MQLIAGLPTNIKIEEKQEKEENICGTQGEVREVSVNDALLFPFNLLNSILPLRHVSQRWNEKTLNLEVLAY